MPHTSPRQPRAPRSPAPQRAAAPAWPAAWTTPGVRAQPRAYAEAQAALAEAWADPGRGEALWTYGLGVQLKVLLRTPGALETTALSDDLAAQLLQRAHTTWPKKTAAALHGLPTALMDVLVYERGLPKALALYKRVLDMNAAFTTPGPIEPRPEVTGTLAMHLAHAAPDVQGACRDLADAWPDAVAPDGAGALTTDGALTTGTMLRAFLFDDVTHVEGLFTRTLSFPKRKLPRDAWMLLRACRSVADVRRVLDGASKKALLSAQPHAFAAVAMRLESGVLDLVIREYPEARKKRAVKNKQGPADRLLAAASSLNTPAAATFLATHLERDTERAAMRRLGDRQPTLALHALYGAATHGSTAAADVLRALAADHPQAAEALRTAHPDAAAWIGTASGPRAHADAAALPAVLRDTPWRRPPREPAVQAPADGWRTAARLDVPDSTRADWERRVRRAYRTAEGRASVEDDMHARPDAYSTGEHLLVTARNAGPDEVRGRLAAMKGRDKTRTALLFAPLLARHGDAAVPAVLGYVARSQRAVEDLVPFIRGTGAADALIDVGHRAEKARPLVERWIAQRPMDTALAALARLATPPPTGTKRPRKADVARHEAGAWAVSMLAAAGLEKTLAAAADTLQLGPDAPGLWAAALAARTPAPLGPHGADLSSLPALVLRADGPGPGGTLPTAAVEAVLDLLVMSTAGEPHRDLHVVTDACTAESCAAFAWAAFDAWRAAGMPTAQRWPFAALAHLGDDGCATRLADALRTWPTAAGAHTKRAVDALATHDTRAGTAGLIAVLDATRSKTMAAQVRAHLDARARTRGTCVDGLRDWHMPTFGLDVDGARVLTYGPRQFLVSFDASLRPVIHDADLSGAGDTVEGLQGAQTRTRKKGKARRGLPPVRSSDDAALAAAAKTRWAALKKAVAGHAKQALHRLEDAMVDQRPWPAAVFAKTMLEHPVLRHVAERLVWLHTDSSGAVSSGADSSGADSSGAGATFRVCADGTFADALDDPSPFTAEHLRVEAGGAVRLMHPALLDADTRSAWQTVFADYGILQPFAQVERAVHDPAGTWPDAPLSRAGLDALRGQHAWQGYVDPYLNQVDTVFCAAGPYRVNVRMDPPDTPGGPQRIAGIGLYMCGGGRTPLRPEHDRVLAWPTAKSAAWPSTWPADGLPLHHADPAIVSDVLAALWAAAEGAS